MARMMRRVTVAAVSTLMIGLAAPMSASASLTRDAGVDSGVAAAHVAPQEAAAHVAPQEAAERLGATGSVDEPFWLRAGRGALGIAFLVGMAVLFSARRRAIDWALVAKGILLQLVFAFLILDRTTPLGKLGWGRAFFQFVNDIFVALIGYTNAGASFIFGKLVDPSTPVTGGEGVVEIGANFAFSVLPTIIFFSSLMAVAYYSGLMQRVVAGVAWLMQRTLGTSGAETTSAAGNIFVGQTEAPLLIRPFVKEMTDSELTTVMTGGFATVAGGVMAAYVAMLAVFFPDIAGHLLAASIMAAPAGIVISKILMPESGTPRTAGKLSVELEQPYENVIDAAAGGAGDGLKLALNVGAMLLAFLALIALANGLLGWATGPALREILTALSNGMLGLTSGLVELEGFTLERIFGWIFAPVAWLVGVPSRDAVEIGSLFGTKMVANEFVAFQALRDGLGGGQELSYKSVIIATYALTGFANFSSIAIQIGGIGGIAPSRRGDLSRLGLRAMLGGTAATWMTATLAGVFS